MSNIYFRFLYLKFKLRNVLRVLIGKAITIDMYDIYKDRQHAHDMVDRYCDFAEQVTEIHEEHNARSERDKETLED